MNETDKYGFERGNRDRTFGALVLPFVLCSTSVAAAVLEEVVVTAQKRTESLQDVPISVATLSGTKIQDEFIMSLEGISSLMPNVTITDSTAAEQVFIRGIGSGANEGFEQSVGTYVDGVYYGRGRSAKTGFVDMARIEILKGPQGVLFGKNTIAGAVNITTNNPTDEFEGNINLGYELEDEEVIAQGYISGPVTDTLGLRLAMRYSDHDGWMDNTFLKDDVAEREEFAGRLTAAWNPTDTLSVIAKVQYTDLELGDRAAQLTVCSEATLARVAGIDDCRFDNNTTMSLLSTNGDRHGYEDYDSLSVGVTVNWDIGEYTLTSVTAYTELESDQALELDFTHIDALSADPRTEDFDSWSQELRLASPTDRRFSFITGLYFETSELHRKNSFNLGEISRVGKNEQDGDSFAVFGSVDWNINEEWTLTVGGRYTEDDKDLDKAMYYAVAKDGARLPITTIPGLGTVHDVSVTRNDDDFSPSVVLKWAPSDSQMYYASYAEGFKAGGYDLASASGFEDEFEFDPEDVESYEVGAKLSLLDNSLELNIALFYSEFSDLQVSTFDGNFALLVGNAAESTSQGVEIDLRWAATDTITVTAAGAYLDAEYDSYKNAQCTAAQTAATPAGTVCIQDLSNRRLTFSPRRSGTVSAVYRDYLTSDMELSLSTDVIYSSRYWVAGDADPNVEENAYWKVNLRAALMPADGNWEAAIMAKNIFNNKTSHWGNDVPAAPGSFYKYLDRTRTVTLSATYNF